MLQLSAADRALLDTELGHGVFDWIKQRYSDRQVSLDSDPQTELGIDSLEWVSLTLELEHSFGIVLTEDVMGRIENVRGLLQEALLARDKGMRLSETVDLEAQERRWLAPRGLVLRIFAQCLYALDFLLMRLVLRLRVKGVQNLPVRGPCVITPNHASYLDGIVICAALPRKILKQVYWAGAADILFTSALRRWFSRIARIIPVDPVHAPASSLALASAVLEHGQSLVWFPEGQLTLDGKLQRLMLGTGELGMKHDVPFVPVHIKGTFEAWPKHRRFPRPRPVEVTFGTARSRENIIAQGVGLTQAERLTDGLYKCLRQLAEETKY
jgi:long-chain acyl-CoA synthetase